LPVKIEVNFLVSGMRVDEDVMTGPLRGAAEAIVGRRRAMESARMRTVEKQTSVKGGYQRTSAAGRVVW
jgi:hypothetical protein